MLTDTVANALVLLVSRDASAMGSRAEDGACRLEVAESGWQALDRVQSNDSPDLVLLDLGENAADGLHSLRWLRRVRPDIPVAVLSNCEDAIQKNEALKLGAKDFLVKPVREAQLASLLERHTDQPPKTANYAVSSDHVEQVTDDMVFVAASAAMQQLRAQVELLAQTESPLLLVGQNDSGKHIAARLIHKLSVRSAFQFVTVNCAALPADTLENELFGLERVVVAGMSRGLPGKFESCEKGTIYFDEITALPLRLQEKLVGVLQDKAFSRAGSDTRVESGCRMIAATQANLEEALANGKLREDLYFRLSAFTVYVPPLKQRKEDISLLLNQLMNQLSRHYDLPARAFSPEVVSACRRYSWPGNLKELENFAKRYLVVGDDELALTELERKSAQLVESHPERSDAKPEPAATESMSDTVDSKEARFGLKSLIQSVKGEAERNAIAMALEQTHWNRKAASKVLQVSYRTLLYKIQHYHLSPPATYLSAVFAAPGIKSNGSRH